MKNCFPYSGGYMILPLLTARVLMSARSTVPLYFTTMIGKRRLQKNQKKNLTETDRI